MHHQSVQQGCRYFLSFTFKSRVCKDVFLQSVATNGQWLRTYSSACQSDRLGVLKEDSTTRGARWSCQAILPVWCMFLRRRVSQPGHRQSMWSSSAGSSPQNRRIGESALWQSNFLLVSRRIRREAPQRLFFCSDGILVLFNALMAAILSMPLVPAFFHFARRSLWLIS